MVDAKTQAILDFLQSQAEAKPELLEMFTQMGDLYARKLWHQLTVLLESFFLQAAAAELLIPIYETFVTDFKHRLNRLALSRLQVCVAKQYKEDRPAFDAQAKYWTETYASGAIIDCPD